MMQNVYAMANIFITLHVYQFYDSVYFCSIYSRVKYITHVTLISTIDFPSITDRILQYYN